MILKLNQTKYFKIETGVVGQIIHSFSIKYRIKLLYKYI